MFKTIFKLTIILTLSVLLIGCNQNNKDNGHTKITVNPPSQNSLNDYKDYSAPVNNDSNKSDNSKQNSETAYIGNKNSKKFHKPDCYAAEKIKEENSITSKSRQQLIDEGFSPCKICNP